MQTPHFTFVVFVLLSTVLMLLGLIVQRALIWHGNHFLRLGVLTTVAMMLAVGGLILTRWRMDDAIWADTRWCSPGPSVQLSYHKEICSSDTCLDAHLMEEP